MEYMTGHDRALFLLSKYNVDVNEHVYKAIICADGLFDKAAEEYFRAYVDTRHILSSIVHFGDWLSTISEKQNWMQGQKVEREEEEVQVKIDKEQVDNMKKTFDELFS